MDIYVCVIIVCGKVVQMKHIKTFDYRPNRDALPSISRFAVRAVVFKNQKLLLVKLKKTINSQVVVLRRMKIIRRL